MCTYVLYSVLGIKSPSVFNSVPLNKLPLGKRVPFNIGYTYNYYIGYCIALWHTTLSYKIPNAKKYLDLFLVQNIKSLDQTGTLLDIINSYNVLHYCVLSIQMSGACTYFYILF